jgi:hypothetical protein
VLVHNIVQQATQTGIINITIKINKQEIVLLEVCTKSFCWPSLLAHQTLLKQGYRKWGVTTFHGEMINYHEFPLGITFHGKIINYHEFPFLLGITFFVEI